MSDLIERLKSKHRNPIRLLRLLGHRLSPNPPRPISPMEVPCSLLIPVAGKDFKMLPQAIDSARRFFQGPLAQIIIVSPQDQAIRTFVQNLGCDWACEDEFLDPCVSRLNYRPRGLNRTGWIKQQLLKLGGDRIVSNRRFLVLDSDTAFVRPLPFMESDKFVLYFSNEYHRPYFSPCRTFLGIKNRFPFSFVTHSMFFDNDLLKQLRSTIEKASGLPWQEAIIGTLDPGEISCFSEFELYGNYMSSFHPERVLTRYWHNRSIGQPQDLDTLVARFGGKFNSVSAHTFTTR